MQRYADFRLIPRNQPDSSPTCCDTLINSRQRKGIRPFRCRIYPAFLSICQLFWRQSQKKLEKTSLFQKHSVYLQQQSERMTRHICSVASHSPPRERSKCTLGAAPYGRRFPVYVHGLW